MSRGLGKMQRMILSIIRNRGKPVTFADMYSNDGTKPDASPFVRSVRRALHKLVKDGTLIAIGDGGRGDPFRYFFHPILMRLMCEDKEEYDALCKAVEADRGAEEAVAKVMMRMSNRGKKRG